MPTAKAMAPDAMVNPAHGQKHSDPRGRQTTVVVFALAALVIALAVVLGVVLTRLRDRQRQLARIGDIEGAAAKARAAATSR
jgi:hypothetical protein